MNINNLHEDITKLKHDTEIAKSKMFSYENISQNKEMFKPKTGHEADEGDEADNFRAVLNFLTLVVTMSKFMMVKIIKSLKVILKMLKLEKRQSFR